MDELTAGGVRVHGKVTTGAGELQVFHVDPPSFRRVALELAAPPCASCAHEPVCALRVAVERLATVETSAPPLPDGLRLSLTATVECSHFLRDKAKLAPVRVLTSQERGQASLRARREVTPEMRENMRQAAFRDQARKRATREGAAAG